MRFTLLIALLACLLFEVFYELPRSRTDALIRISDVFAQETRRHLRLKVEMVKNMKDLTLS